ncbi:TetR/AcrR family transcriptional regulator [Streptomyces roseoverticillatus]|uniref:TetR/AcrR family transcriptional regulator n=1 Tax=Streptomyces roseoverticillatus TaxID=66429 RepID=UPI000694449C|nr:helix-turn-helix domain-containing protein [Streptomyces roseoverticillatus]
MPAARELLLDAAFAALRTRPWNGVRMVDVAASAGVSRQTLYNEFGSKDGLARALVRREAEAFLAGVERALSASPATAVPATAPAAGADAGARCAAAACWILRTARANPLVRAALTGCRGERLPAAAAPVLPAPRGPFARAVPRSAPGAAPLADAIRDRTVRAVSGTAGERAPEVTLWACEAAVRLTLSYVVAPGASDEEAAAQVARLVRTLVGENVTEGPRPEQ